MIASTKAVSLGNSTANASESPSTKGDRRAGAQRLVELVEVIRCAPSQQLGQLVDGEPARVLHGPQRRAVEGAGHRAARVDSFHAVGHRQHRHHDGAAGLQRGDHPVADACRRQRSTDVVNQDVARPVVEVLQPGGQALRPRARILGHGDTDGRQPLGRKGFADGVGQRFGDGDHGRAEHRLRDARQWRRPRQRGEDRACVIRERRRQRHDRRKIHRHQRKRSR